MNFTEVPPEAFDPDVTIDVRDLGNTGERGKTLIYTTSGLAPNDFVEEPYHHTVVQLNRFYLDIQSDAYRQSIALHELGHALSLAHRYDLGDPNGGVTRSDMNNYIITTLNSNDIALVNSRYP